LELYNILVTSVMKYGNDRLGTGRLDDPRARFPAGAGNFSFRHRVQTDSYSVVTEGSFPGGKVSGAWSYTSTRPVCLHGVLLS